MKEVFLTVAVLSLILVGCDSDNKSNNGNGHNVSTLQSFTIKNESGHVISNMKWNGFDICPEPFVLLPGRTITQNVQHGSGYITLAFYFHDNGSADMGMYTYGFRTQTLIVFDEGENFEFVFTNNTILVDEDNKEDTLNYFANRIATLTIRNESPFRLSASWNNTDFVSFPNASFLEPATFANRRWSNLHFSGANLPVLIKINLGSITLLTEELVSVGKWDKKEFVIRANTIVIDQNSISGELGSFLD